MHGSDSDVVKVALLVERRPQAWLYVLNGRLSHCRAERRVAAPSFSVGVAQTVLLELRQWWPGFISARHIAHTRRQAAVKKISDDN